MIKVNITDDTITIKGHAGFADYGKDIVCASVSSIVTTTVNNIHVVNSKVLNYSDDGNVMKINITLEDQLVIKLFDNLKEMLIDLSKEYPKNIMLKEE